MKKGIVRLKERIQTFFTMGVYRPTGSYHEESCNITLLSTRWTTSTPLFRVILWQCLFTFVDPRAITFSRPTRTPHLPLASQSPSSNSSTMRTFKHLFFRSHFCSSCVELFVEKSLESIKKSQMKSTTLGRFLVVNGCSKGKGRFSCSFHDLSAHKALWANLK
jgi:hypothetical protein